jgi:hypothetical protein
VGAIHHGCCTVNQLVEPQREQTLNQMLPSWARVELIVLDELAQCAAGVTGELLL